MASLKDLAGDTPPVIGYPKSIEFGPVRLDGYMLENGEFRQSVHSTETALGAAKSKIITRMLVPRFEGSTPVASSQTPVVATGLTQNGVENATSDPIIVPVRCPGVQSHGSVAYTVNLPMAVELWKQTAIGGGKYSRAALELLGLSAVHSLERVYQEAFGVEDSRKTSDRLLDWAIRMDAGKHFPLFGGQFHKNFQRVTGVAFGHRYASTCLADLIYHRLPETVYETLKDINPADERGWRQFTHSQLMTDEMHQQMREIVAAVNNQLANTPAKADDPKAYAKLLRRLDKTLPRYKTRGYKPAQQLQQENNG